MSNMPQKAEEATSWSSKGSLQNEKVYLRYIYRCFPPPIVNPGVDSKRNCCFTYLNWYNFVMDQAMEDIRNR